MTEIKPHEYTLLNEIAQDSMLTQANLSDRLGIAVGSVNWYMKRLITRGWVKVSHLNRTRLRYDLTSEGLSILTQRALQYMQNSLSVYADVRKQAKEVVAGLISQGFTSVYLDGHDERMDILQLTCIEGGLGLDDMPDKAIIKVAGQGFQVITQ